jgi:hypothetical protein
VVPPWKEIRREQRAQDRSLQAMNPFNLMAVDPFSTGEQLCLLEIPKVADVVAQKSERRKEMVGSAVRTPWL